MAKDKTMTDIVEAVKRLSKAHVELTVRAEAQEADIVAAVTPIADRHRPGIEEAAEEQASAHDALMRLLHGNPQCFKRPRSITVDGVRAGYKKEPDGLAIPNAETTITRIRALFPDLEDLLIRKEESLVIDALSGLDDKQKQAIGVRDEAGLDEPFIRIGDTDVKKLVKAILADYAKRLADEAPKAKTKAKAKAEATA